jgi:hypothetical protein
MTAFVKTSSIRRSQDRATTGRQYARRPERQLVNHRCFQITETAFAFAIKVLPDRASKSLLDHMIRVKKRNSKPATQLAADGGLARPWQTHQRNQQ